MSRRRRFASERRERSFASATSSFNPEFHTWFGNRSEVYEDLAEESHDNVAHDQIGQILVSFGFVGLGFFLGVMVLGLVIAHRGIFRQRDPVRRRMMLGCLSVLIATLFSGMLFGSHLECFRSIFSLHFSWMFLRFERGWTTKSCFNTGPVKFRKPETSNLASVMALGLTMRLSKLRAFPKELQIRSFYQESGSA